MPQAKEVLQKDLVKFEREQYDLLAQIGEVQPTSTQQIKLRYLERRIAEITNVLGRVVHFS